LFPPHRELTCQHRASGFLAHHKYLFIPNGIGKTKVSLQLQQSKENRVPHE
jgi:hypothetical protein